MTKFYMIGIGGSGMSVVAELLVDRGHEVSGSDRSDRKSLARLRELGVKCYVGHDASQVPPDATVVVTSAVHDDNPELMAAKQLGLPIMHRSQALALAAEGLDFVAVAGTHGKTTTSAMLATVLAHCNQDPSFAVGGVVKHYGTGAHLGKGHWFVAEADESDGSFMNYSPWLTIITNIEADHLSHYGNEAALQESFVSFVGRIRQGGALVVGTDDPGARQVAQQVADQVRLISFGREPFTQSVAHVSIKDEVVTPVSASATLAVSGQWNLETTVELPVSGAQNLLNAAATFGAGLVMELDPAQMAQGLATYEGTGRRFELRGEIGGVRVFDDYGHHPTEVAVTLRQARTVAGQGRVLILFQPHLYSRTRDFPDRFAQALELADVPFVCDIDGSREDPIPGVHANLITDLMSDKVRYVGPREQAARQIALESRPGDIILTMGCGNITQMVPVILQTLQERP